MGDNKNRMDSSSINDKILQNTNNFNNHEVPLKNKRSVKRGKRHSAKTNPIFEHISQNGIIKQVKDKRHDRKSRREHSKKSTNKKDMDLNFFEDDELSDNSYDKKNVFLKEVKIKMSDEKFDNTLKQLLMEYFNHYQKNEIEEFLLEEALDDQFKIKTITIILTFSLDKKPKQKELVSVLLGYLSIKSVLEVDHFEQGFISIFHGFDDILLDSPQAIEDLSKFIARAIADDCIPPRFIYNPSVDNVLYQVDNGHFLKSLKLAIELITKENGIATLDSIWCQCSSIIRPVRSLSKQIIKILNNLMNEVESISEVQKLFDSLQIPHFFHEIVYESFVLFHNDTVRFSKVKAMIISFFDSGFFTSEQIEKGLKRILEDLDQIIDDDIISQANLEDLVKSLMSSNAISKDSVELLFLSKGIKRYISEGDGEKIKPEH